MSCEHAGEVYYWTVNAPDSTYGKGQDIWTSAPAALKKRAKRVELVMLAGGPGSVIARTESVLAQEFVPELITASLNVTLFSGSAPVRVGWPLYLYSAGTPFAAQLRAVIVD